MIFVNNPIYGKVWKIQTKSGKYMDIQMSTSEKNSEGGYANSSWFPRLIGHAFNSLKDTLKEGDTITINKCKLTNERVKDQDGAWKSNFRFIILDASISDGHQTQPQAQETRVETPHPADDEECPW